MENNFNNHLIKSTQNYSNLVKKPTPISILTGENTIFIKTNQNQLKDNYIKKVKSNTNVVSLSNEKAHNNVKRVSLCESNKNKKMKKNSEIKKINYYFSKPKYLMQINNFINEDKKLRENKNIINNISLSTFLKNKNSEKKDNLNNHNTFNISSLVVQNLNNKIDKEIKFRNNVDI